MKISRKRIKRLISRNSIYLVFILFSVSCLLLLFNFSFPEVSQDNTTVGSHEASLQEGGLGEFGDMMVAMLPDDLAFTVFVPSRIAFEQILHLRANESLMNENVNNTYAIVSRVLGFAAIPQHLHSGAVPMRKEVTFDSISGFKLYAWKDFDGTLVVNGVRSDCVDIKKAEMIVHVMRGVIMDAEFEQSFSPDYEGR